LQVISERLLDDVDATYPSAGRAELADTDEPPVIVGNMQMAGSYKLLVLFLLAGHIVYRMRFETKGFLLEGVEENVPGITIQAHERPP
jgi:hypothetical protein